MVKRIALILVVIGAVLVVANFDLLKKWISDPIPRSINAVEQRLLFGEDPTLDELIDALHSKKIISSKDEARKIAKEISLTDDKIEGGKYVILPETRLDNLLGAFERDTDGRGKGEVLVNVIFNNCRDLYDVSKNVSVCISADSASLAEHLLHPETLRKYGFTAAQMPAMILPQQYEMEFDTNASEFVAFMAERFKEFWTDERKGKLHSIGLQAPSQAVTLASIVYSEQGKIQEEWPIIAALYLNRIKKGMKLKSDPTFKFCWGRELDDVQYLTAKHRDIECDYNTYHIQGLPPGPICITPAKVVDAVLNKANVNYLFMCAKPDYSGEHNFTASDVQHMRNASIYQKWIRTQS
jgi:UPF0755 protein